MFYYSTSILEKAGVKESRVASCAVGVVSVIMTGVTVSTCFDGLGMCVQYPDFLFWSDIPLTNRVREPYWKLQTEIFPFRIMAQARSARAINRRGKYEDS